MSNNYVIQNNIFGLTEDGVICYLSDGGRIGLSIEEYLETEWVLHDFQSFHKLLQQYVESPLSLSISLILVE